MVSFSVLGCGRIGRMHAGNLARHPMVRLKSVFDVIEGSAAACASALGVRHAPTVEAVLSDPEVDAVLIATPTDTHVGLIVQAVRAGKAVLCEKPIDLDIGRVRACRDEIAGLSPRVMIGFNRRFDPSFSALRRRVEAGEIGRLEQVVITSRDPSPPPVSYIGSSGGLFRDMMIHDLDLARAVVGEVESVFAAGAVVDPAIGAAGDIDSAMVTLRARSGVLVHITNSRTCVYGYDQRLEAFGSKGMLIADNRRETTVEAYSGERTAARDPVLHFFIERYAEAYVAEIAHFAQSLRDGVAPSPGFDDGMEALRLADAAAESLRSGQAVTL